MDLRATCLEVKLRVPSSLLTFEDSKNFEHHFMANNVLRPHVATREGDLGKKTEVERFQESDDEETLESPERKAIPRDLRLPGALIMFCCFNNNLSYVFEFSTFAIFFKQYHGWNEAVWASFAQTAGDLLAAIVMKVLGSEIDTDEEVGCFWRLFRQPYSFLELDWSW